MKNKKPSSLDAFSLELTDEQAIKHLKGNGYKITKMIETEF